MKKPQHGHRTMKKNTEKTSVNSETTNLKGKYNRGKCILIFMFRPGLLERLIGKTVKQSQSQAQETRCRLTVL